MLAAAVEAVEVVLVPLVQRGHGPRGGDGARDGDPEAGHAADAGPEPAGLGCAAAVHHRPALATLPLACPALPGLPLAAAAAGRRLQSSPLLLTPHLIRRYVGQVENFANFEKYLKVLKESLLTFVSTINFWA